MRKTIPVLLILFALLALTLPTYAQSTDKIIERYRKASGGNAAKKIQATLMTGSIRYGDNATGRFSYQTANPDRIRIDVETETLKFSECYNGKSAWRQDKGGLRTLLGREAKRLRLQALLANTRLHKLSRYRIIAQAAKKADVEGRPANVIEFSLNDAHAKLYFDATTHLLIKQECEATEGTEEIFYSDYRAIDKVMEPFSIKIKNGKDELLITIDRVAHNQPLDEAALRYPKPTEGAPLPDVETLMKNVVANQEKVQELVEQYTYKETETERKFDDKGRVKESETRVYQVIPIAGDSVRRLISINGKELSPSEREKEDKRVKKETEEIRRNRQKKEEKKKKGKEEDDDDEITILRFLQISNITSIRREVFRNQEVIAFDFEPRKGYQPKNRAESLISKLAGTFFVDEKEKQIVRLESRLIDSFKFAGGLLASISPSTAFVFEQEKVRNEVWLPSHAELNYAGRALLFVKFNGGVILDYSDYQKYQTDVDLKFEQSEQ
ncbi:MAG: hypothetical protein AB1489_18390 [Acidobacteriota bacterium]